MKKHLKLTVSLLAGAALAAAAICVGCAQSDPLPETPTTASGSPLIAADTLTVSSTLSHDPYESVSSWEPAGFSVDITREVARRLGLECSFDTTKTSDKALDAVCRSQADLALASFTSAQLTKADGITASDPYTTFDSSVVTMIDHQIPTLEALAAMPEVRVGVVGGTAGEAWAQEHLSGADFVTFESSAAAFSELQSGGIEAIVVDTPTAKRTVHTILSNATIIATAQAETSYVYALNAEDPSLKNEVNAALEHMQEDGTYQRIYDEWFNVEPASHDSSDARVPEQDQQGFAK